MTEMLSPLGKQTRGCYAGYGLGWDRDNGQILLERLVIRAIKMSGRPNGVSLTIS